MRHRAGRAKLLQAKDPLRTSVLSHLVHQPQGCGAVCNALCGSHASDRQCNWISGAALLGSHSFCCMEHAWEGRMHTQQQVDEWLQTEAGCGWQTASDALSAQWCSSRSVTLPGEWTAGLAPCSRASASHRSGAHTSQGA